MGGPGLSRGGELHLLQGSSVGVAGHRVAATRGQCCLEVNHPGAGFMGGLDHLPNAKMIVIINYRNQ